MSPAQYRHRHGTGTAGLRDAGCGQPLRGGYRPEHYEAYQLRDCRRSSTAKSAKEDISLRVITDHIRSTTIYGGRRRRALQRGPRLCAAPPAAPGRPSWPPAGHRSAFPVSRSAKRSSPKTLALIRSWWRRKTISSRCIKVEEERFAPTPSIRAWKSSTALWIKSSADQINQKPCSPAQDAFRLYDTFGFPIDLIQGDPG